jgi:hypothetical protein
VTNIFRRNHLGLLVVLLALLGLLAGGAAQAAPSSETPELLQFTSAGHVLGFQPEGMIVASGSHTLRVEFVNPNLLPPYICG